MTMKDQINAAARWAEILRRSSGRISATYVYGNIVAEANQDGVSVSIDGVPVDSILNKEDIKEKP